jgi:hypothetical protein
MSTLLKIGDKGRHIIMPDGFRLMDPDEKVVPGCMVANLYTAEWEQPDEMDFDEAALFCGDVVVIKIANS